MQCDVEFWRDMQGFNDVRRHDATPIKKLRNNTELWSFEVDLKT